VKKYLKQAYRNLAFKNRRLVGLEKSLVLSGEIRAAQIAAQGQLGCLADAEFSVFSQWGEDGILSWLVDRIQPESRTFVEFGVEDYRECNTRFLLISRNWSGMIIDGSPENIAAIQTDDVAYKYDLRTVCSFITRDNIAGLIAGAGFGTRRLGILSVDIDGNDYWVLEKAGVEADIVVVEYNDYFGSRPVSVPYKEDFTRMSASPTGMYWGASLAAFRHLLEGRGYIFAGTNRSGTNAFFVHGTHRGLIDSTLRSVKSYPCVMREARQPDGSLSFKQYKEIGHHIADMPLIEVTNGSKITVRDCIST
jgi:hypothetical protein